MGYKRLSLLIVIILGLVIVYKQVTSQADEQDVLQALDDNVQINSQVQKESQPRCAYKHEVDDSIVTQSLQCDDIKQQQNIPIDIKEDEKSRTVVVPTQVVLQSALLSKKHKNDRMPVAETVSETKVIEEQDMHEVCIALPDQDVLVQRLKKAGFPGLAKNKKFIEEISSKTFSSLELYEILSNELDKFKDVWVAHQRRGKLCNVLFQDYPDYVAYLKQREKIDDNPRLYWKAAKLYAKKLQPLIN